MVIIWAGVGMGRRGRGGGGVGVAEFKPLLERTLTVNIALMCTTMRSTSVD